MTYIFSSDIFRPKHPVAALPFPAGAMVILNGYENNSES